MTTQEIKTEVSKTKNAIGFELAAEDYNKAIAASKFLTANKIYLQVDKLMWSYNLAQKFSTKELFEAYKS